MTIEIYDPPLCCPSGLCGPAVDPSLMKINDAVWALKKQGVEVVRYNLKTDYNEIKDNSLFMELLHKNGIKILPVTVINGSVIKAEEYPSYQEICAELGIEPLTSNKPITMQIG